MKRIYVNSEILKEAVDYINDDITFFGFISHLKVFLKNLLTNPIETNIDDYLKRHGIDKDELLDELEVFELVVLELEVLGVLFS